MALIGEISAQLRADNSDFKAKLSEAEQGAEKFDKQLKKFGLGFGGIAALATAFRAIVDYARDLEDPLDANLIRAKAFAGGIDDAKNGMLELGAKALGVVNGLGEWIGRGIAIVKNGKEQVELAETIEAQTQETIKSLAKTAKAAAEIGDLKKKTLEVEKKSAEEAVKQLDLADQIALAESKLQSFKDEVRLIEGDKLALAKNELATATARADLEKLYATQKKQNAEAQKKSDQEAEAAEVEAHVAAMDRLQAKAAAEEEADIEDHMRLQDRIVAQKAAEAEELADLDLQLGKLQEQGLSREQMIVTLRQMGHSEEEILATLQAQTEAVRDRITISRVGTAYQSQSTTALEGVRARLEENLRTLGTDGRMIKDATQGSNYGSFAAASLYRGELAAVERELAQRREIQNYAKLYGEQATIRQYGDSLSDRAFKELQDTQTKTLTALEEIRQRMAGSPLFKVRG